MKSGEEWVKSGEYLFTCIMCCVSVVYIEKVKSGEEWVKSGEYLFTCIMCCVSVVYIEKVKSEEQSAIFLSTVLELK